MVMDSLDPKLVKPRRKEDYMATSASSKVRNQPRVEVSKDPYAVSRRGLIDQPLQGNHRSLSPHNMVEGSRRVSHREGKSGSAERKDYGWNLGATRTEKIHSGSSLYVQERNKPPFDEGIAHRKYEHAEERNNARFDERIAHRKYEYAEERNKAHFDERISHRKYEHAEDKAHFDEMISHRKYEHAEDKTQFDERIAHRKYEHAEDKAHFDERIAHRKFEHGEDIIYDEGKSDRSHQVHGYDHHVASTRMNEEKDYTDKGIASIDGHGMMKQKKLNPVEDGLIRGSYHAPSDSVPVSNYREACGHGTLPLQHMDIEKFEHEKLGYCESMPSDRRPMMELYKDGEKPIFHSRDIPYTRVPVSHSNEFGSSSQFKNFAGTSSGFSRGEFAHSYRESPLHAADEYARGNVKFVERIDYDVYGQRLELDPRNFEPEKKIVTGYRQGPYAPTGVELDDYLYTKSQRVMKDDYGYSSNELQRMMPSHPQLVYEHTRMHDEHRELPKASVMRPVVDDIIQMDGSYGTIRKSAVWDHPPMQKQVATDNLDANRLVYPPKHSGEFFDSGYCLDEFGRRELRDDETSRLAVTQDQPISHMRPDYGFGRDSGPRFQEERLQDPSLFMHDFEMQRHAVKRHRMREEHSIYDLPDKGFKKKYQMEGHMNRRDKRTMTSYKWNTAKESLDKYDNSEEWIDKDTNALHAPRNQRFEHNTYRKFKRTYDGRENPVDIASEDWLSSQDSLQHARRHPVEYHKPTKYMKGSSKSVSSSWYNSNKIDKSGIHRQHRTWKRNGNYDEDVHTNGDNPPEEWMNLGESELSEDSVEFKQLVDEAFLSYAKKLNLNSSVQRRYKEQGKAGSLFCIVCGRSSSKEFMDTQRLVTHAYMSHKVGLRAQHLGLHRAICVLMGWNSFVPCDTITWVPDILPDGEALAQKEDLILWPPLVIIHNISMTNNHPEKQKVIPIEGVEAFLRAKGFVGGKISVSLGKPADQSVMLVKFLNTFTGLEMAERLHRYFIENKHGREEFERKASNDSKSSNNSEAEMPGEKLEEVLLYGYMGIAEDLDSLDFSTKKKITIKSKKEIQDLANAPVKADDR